jgi:hypothetical protein
MRLAEMEIPFERDVFLRALIRKLSGVLEDVVGIKEAFGLSAWSEDRSANGWMANIATPCAFRISAATKWGRCVLISKESFTL